MVEELWYYPTTKNRLSIILFNGAILSPKACIERAYREESLRLREVQKKRGEGGMELIAPQSELEAASNFIPLYNLEAGKEEVMATPRVGLLLGFEIPDSMLLKALEVPFTSFPRRIEIERSLDLNYLKAVGLTPRSNENFRSYFETELSKFNIPYFVLKMD